MNKKALPVTCVTHKTNSIYKHSNSHKTLSEKNKTLFYYVLNILPKFSEPRKGPADVI